MRRLLLLFGLLLFWVPGSAQQIAVIGAGSQSGTSSNGATGDPGPMYKSTGSSSFIYSRHHYLYTESELMAAGIFPGVIIDKLSWNKDNNAASNADFLFEIWLKNSNRTTVQSTPQSWDDLTSLAGGTQVYNSSSTSLPSSTGWVEFPLSSPFVYTGGSLEISVNFDMSAGSSPWTTDGISWLKDPISDRTISYVGSSPSTSLSNARTVRPQLQISYASPAANNTGVSEINALSASCPGSYPVEVEISNYGINQIDSVTVEWTVNGTAQSPLTYTNLLDTINGSGSNTAIVNLGNYSFSAGQSYAIKAWTVDPNGVTDTVNEGDTATTTLELAAPYGLSVDNITSNSADLQWNSAGSTIYNIIYGAPGFDPTTEGTEITSVSSPHNLTGLSSNTEYDFYVYADCGGGIYSDTSVVESFITLCGIYSVPFSEDFSNGEIPDCWEISSSGTSEWEFSGTAAYSTVTDPSGTYAWVDGSSPFTDTDVTLQTPRIDVSSLTEPHLSFVLYMENTQVIDDNMSFEVNFYDGASWNNSIYYVDTNLPRGFLRIDIPLSSYTITGPVQFQFVVDKTINGSSFYNDIVLDDVVVDEAPPCLDPQQIELETVGPYSASFTFISEGSNFQYEYGREGYGQGTGTLGNGGNPLSISGLNQGTSYDLYIRMDCGSDGSSNWIGPFTFTTTCIETFLPYYENFNSWPPPCIDSTGGDDYWSLYDNGGNNFAMADYSTGVSNRYMTTQPIVIDEPAQVRYKWSHNTSPNDSLILEMEINQSGEWERIRYITGDEFETDNGTYNSPGDFKEDRLFLNVPLDDTVKVRLRSYQVSSGDAIYIDDLYVEEGQACPTPQLLVLDTLTSSSATVSFNWYNGGMFDYEYGPTGFTLGNGTQGSGGNPLTATGMSEQTTYDMYVRANCSSDTSGWIGPITFTTLCSNGLNGTYTIDPGQAASATNFTDISSAVEAVNVCGIAGPVIFNIKEGTYSEQINLSGHPQLGEIVGSSASNTVIFQSDPANTNLPEINYSASGTEDNFVINLEGASYMTFKDLILRATGSAYARVVEMSGGNNHHITFIGDSIITDPFSSSSNRTGIYSNAPASDILIVNNVFVGGYYPIYFNGSSSDVGSGITISNNEMKDWYYSASYIQYIHNVVYTSNEIYTRSYSYYPLRVYYCENSEVHNNRIDVTGTSTMYTMYIYASHGTSVTGNEIKAITSGATNYGLYYYNNDNESSNRSLIANNMVVNGGTGVVRGIYVYSSENTDIINNSANVVDGSTSSRAMEVSSTGSGTIILNNNLVNNAEGYAFYGTSANVDDLDSLDFNNYYTNGTDIAYYSGAESTLSDWQSATGRDTNSVSGDPVFYAMDDLRVLGNVVNDAGTPFPSVTTDIDGEPRSATTPDIGIDEFTPPAGDLDLFAGEFLKTTPCLSNSDTVALYIQNIIGGSVDFSTTPLTINYEVNGPVNTSGSITQNTGTLDLQDTLTITISTIDMSVPGEYTLNAYIDSNSLNAMAFNDTLGSVSLMVDTILTVSPRRYILPTAEDSVAIYAKSPFLKSNFLITEVSHYVHTVGEPVGGWPSYLIADDYIEITGVPGSDLGGITLEQWDGSSMMSTHTFPSGTFLSPNGTAIIAVGQMSSSVESPSNYYYHGNGAFTGTFGSGGNNGRILKDAGGNIIDAVGVGTSYSFPASAGVTAADWSGNSGNHTTTSGVRLEGPDDNTASNWVVSSSSSPQDPNALNPGVSIPLPSQSAAFDWSLNGSVVDTTTRIYAGPFDTSGTYEFIATLVTPCNGGITYTDTVQVIVPSCDLPENLNAVAITSDSASLTWDASANANNFTIIYGETGFDPASEGTTITSTSDSVRVGGFTGYTEYDFYIISDCGATDGKSDTSEAGTFTTLCSFYPAPYSQDFNGGVQPGCWDVFTTTSSTSANAFWKFTGAATYSEVSDASGTYAWVDGSSPFTETDVTLSSPMIDLSSFSSPQLSFDLYMENTNVIDDNMGFSVNFYDGSNWHNAIYYMDDNLPGGFKRISIPLAAYSISGPAQVEFVVDKTVNGSSFYNDIVLDSITFEEGPACPRPVSLNATQITPDSATISWMSPSSISDWTIVYDTTGFDPQTGGTTLSVTSDTYSLGGLNSNTSYQFYVISDCGTGGVSDTAGPYSFITPCAPAVAPFAESFGNSELPDCWTSSTSASSEWEFTGTATYSTVTDPSGTYAWVDGSSPFTDTSVVLRSPLIDISGLAIPQLSFDLYMENTDVIDDNMGFTVRFYDGASWHSIYYEDDNLPGGYGRIELPLDAYTITGPVQFEFEVDKTVNGSSFYNDIVLDSVVVDEGPTCPNPLDFHLASSTASSSTLSWIAGSLAQDFVVEYDTVGFTPGTGTRITTSFSTVTINSLPTNVPHEAYLKVNCGQSDSSEWIGPIEFGALTLCDDLENYSAGPVLGTSLLFDGWYGDDYDGAFSTFRAQSGITSLHIHDTAAQEASDVIAAFEPINSGIWDVTFSMYVESGAGAYYNIQQNYDPTGTNNLWAVEIFFDDAGNGYVELSDTAYGTFSYTQGQWETVTTMIDLDNDSAWLELNGTSTGIGWQHTADNPNDPVQFNGVNFYSGVYDDDDYDINYFMDDFCISDASACPVPTALGATNVDEISADVYWSGNGTAWNVEYGAVGFIQGTGNMMASANDTLAVTGLQPETCYDFYVQNDCSTDSSVWAGPFTFCTDELIICPEAGADANTTVCDTIDDLDLNDHLSGADAGGNWIDADGTGALTGSIFDATAGTVSYNNTYDFWYVIAATADCPADTATISVAVDSCKTSGIEENILSSSLNIFPNPTSGDVYVQFETASSEDAEISILDLSGKVIYFEEAGNINGRYEGKVSLNQLAKGTYLLKVESGSLKAVKRIVKQ